MLPCDRISVIADLLTSTGELASVLGRELRSVSANTVMAISAITSFMQVLATAFTPIATPVEELLCLDMTSGCLSCRTALPLRKCVLQWSHTSAHATVVAASAEAPHPVPEMRRIIICGIGHFVYREQRPRQ